MSKKVTAVKQAHMGHVHVEFEDGSMQMLTRDQVKDGAPKVGEFYPPLPKLEGFRGTGVSRPFAESKTRSFDL
jgi:hypothetical protein